MTRRNGLQLVHYHNFRNQQAQQNTVNNMNKDQLAKQFMDPHTYSINGKLYK